MTSRSVIFAGTRFLPAEVIPAAYGALEAGYKVALLSPAPPLFSSAALSGMEIVDMSDRARAIEAALRLAWQACSS